MKVKKLIQKLSKFDPEMEIKVGSRWDKDGINDKKVVDAYEPEQCDYAVICYHEKPPRRNRIPLSKEGYEHASK